jgi:fluoride exporter
VKTYLLVGLGSLLGGGARALISLQWLAWFGAGWPWGTLFVNLTGSFAIGLYATACGPHGRYRAGEHAQQFAIAGLCGGYTTFSIFSLESIALWQSGAAITAASYVLASVTTWLGAVWLGVYLGERLNAADKAH